MGEGVRGQKEERGDQMCFPDKIALVPASLMQNTHRYQLARCKQGVPVPSMDGRWNESVCVTVDLCVFANVHLEQFKTKENKQACVKITNMHTASSAYGQI